MSAADAVTVLRAVDNSILTKRIKRSLDDEWLVAGYDRAFWFSVTEEPVNDFVDLGVVLERISLDPQACVIRGRPKPGINRKRTWRLLYDTIDDEGREREATFESAPRRFVGLDFDNVPVMTWCPDGLARRRAAIERDRAEHGMPQPKGTDDGEDVDLDGDGDPAPVDPVRDWPLACKLAVAALPAEFHSVSAWWQMTSSAGLKPGGIRLRMWFWLGRAVSDDECKRWLKGAPVDRSLFNLIQVHYTAAPLFDNPVDDPVLLRNGFWWRHENMVRVPELPESPPPPEIEQGPLQWTSTKVEADNHREIVQDCLARNLTAWERDFCTKIARHATITEAQAEILAKIADPLPAKARAYAEKALDGVRTAPAGDRHPTLMAVAVRLYSLAYARLLDEGGVTRQLLSAGEAPLSAAERIERCTRHGGRPSKNEQAIDWARAKAKASPDVAEGFRA